MFKTLWIALIAVFSAVTFGLSEAEARRMSGGRSVGTQSPNVTQKAAPAPQQAPSAAPTSPATQPGAAAARPGQPAAAPAGNRWLAPLAGIAAGLGLAALASHLGFGEELATILLMALLAVAVLVVVRLVMARRAAAQPPAPAYAGRYPFTGLGQEASVPNYQPVPAPAASSAQPVDVVRDAAAPVTTWRIPEGFDADGFVRNAKVYFVRLQAAFDAGNVDDLREFTTPEMFAELKIEIDERNDRTEKTDVVTLDAQLLGIDDGPREHLASVRFSGLLREAGHDTAQPFDEVWNFARPLDGKTGWVLAGIQQLAPQ